MVQRSSLHPPEPWKRGVLGGFLLRISGTGPQSLLAKGCLGITWGPQRGSGPSTRQLLDLLLSLTMPLLKNLLKQQAVRQPRLLQPQPQSLGTTKLDQTLQRKAQAAQAAQARVREVLERAKEEKPLQPPAPGKAHMPVRSLRHQWTQKSQGEQESGKQSLRQTLLLKDRGFCLIALVLAPPLWRLRPRDPHKVLYILPPLQAFGRFMGTFLWKSGASKRVGSMRWGKL